MKLHFLIFGWILASVSSTSVLAQHPLDQYLKLAIDSNLELQQKQQSYEKSRNALAEARKLFYPSVDLRVDYTLAGGGRTIDLPLGDLMNPVYSTLNQLTASNRFPTLQNQSVLLNPHNFYDARVRTSGPILNPELQWNRTIKSQQVSMRETEVELFKRELKNSVQKAYYQYEQATEAIGIYQQALTLLQEQLRVNESLQRNDKINRTAVIRAASEVSQMQATLQDAEANRVKAAAYFNFLLNRSLRDSILLPPSNTASSISGLPLLTVAGSEEWRLVQQGKQVLESQTNLIRAANKPRLNAFLDLGSQGFGRVNDKTAYYLAGISLQWNLFEFGRTATRQAQVQADKRALLAQEKQVARQLELRYLVALESYQAALKNSTAAEQRVIASKRYYDDMFLVYKQGQALYIELLDAQQQWTTARIQASIARAAKQEKFADLQRAAIQ